MAKVTAKHMDFSDLSILELKNKNDETFAYILGTNRFPKDEIKKFIATAPFTAMGFVNDEKILQLGPAKSKEIDNLYKYLREHNLQVVTNDVIKVI